MSLMNSYSLTFTRYAEQDVDLEGNAVQGNALPPIETKGNLQPYRLGQNQRLDSSGKHLNDVRTYYTKTLLRAGDPHTQTVADTCQINGTTFYVFDAGDWTTTTISTRMAHYKVILVRQEEGKNA